MNFREEEAQQKSQGEGALAKRLGVRICYKREFAVVSIREGGGTRDSGIVFKRGSATEVKRGFREVNQGLGSVLSESVRVEARRLLPARRWCEAGGRLVPRFINGRLSWDLGQKGHVACQTYL